MRETSSGNEWAYTLADIAAASGVSIHTVRDHKQQGLLHPESLADVARYISGWRSIKSAQRPAEKRMTHETDIWGNPA